MTAKSNMIEFTFHAAILVLYLASAANANTIDEGGLVPEGGSNETKHSQSEKNDTSTTPGTSNLTESIHPEPIVEIPSKEMQQSTPIDGDKETAKNISKSTEPLEDGVTTEKNLSNPANSDNVTAHAIDNSTTLTSTESAGTNVTVASKPLDKNNATKHAPGSVTNSSTLDGFPGKTQKNSTLGNSSGTKSKNSTEWRQKERNATSEEKYWNVWSGSSRTVPTTRLLAAAAVCILVRKATLDLGPE